MNYITVIPESRSLKHELYHSGTHHDHRNMNYITVIPESRSLKHELYQ